MNVSMRQSVFDFAKNSSNHHADVFFIFCRSSVEPQSVILLNKRKKKKMYVPKKCACKYSRDPALIYCTAARSQPAVSATLQRHVDGIASARSKRWKRRVGSMTHPRIRSKVKWLTLRKKKIKNRATDSNCGDKAGVVKGVFFLRVFQPPVRTGARPTHRLTRRPAGWQVWTVSAAAPGCKNSRNAHRGRCRSLQSQGLRRVSNRVHNHGIAALVFLFVCLSTIWKMEFVWNCPSSDNQQGSSGQIRISGPPVNSAKTINK